MSDTPTPQQITQRIELVKGPQEAVLNVISALITVGAVYLVVNPNGMEQLTDWLEKQQRKVNHKLSVWLTRSAIRSLPETSD